MTLLAPTLQAFFTTRITSQFGASPHTVAAYRDTWRLLLDLPRATPPARRRPTWTSADLDAALVSGFLDPPGGRARQQRLHPQRPAGRDPLLFATPPARTPSTPPRSHGAGDPGQARRPHRRDLPDPTEIDALLAAPDQTTWAGRRDHALLQLAVQTGLRVSELTGLNCEDLHLGAGPTSSATGRDARTVSRRWTAQTVAILRAWHRRSLPPGTSDRVPHPDRNPHEPRRRRSPPDRARRHRRRGLHHHGQQTDHPARPEAQQRQCDCCTAGIDSTVIALWLGHESVDTTRIYLHADMKIKERAMDRTAPTGAQPGRYIVTDDKLLTFLQSL